MMDKKMYYAVAEGFIVGKYRKFGDPVGLLSEAQAKYPLLAGQISAEKPTILVDGDPSVKTKKDT